MAELSNDDVRAMARAVGIDLREPELTEVAHHIRALIEAMDAIDEPGLGEIEPMPMPADWPSGPGGR